MLNTQNIIRALYINAIGLVKIEASPVNKFLFKLASRNQFSITDNTPKKINSLFSPDKIEYKLSKMS